MRNPDNTKNKSTPLRNWMHGRFVEELHEPGRHVVLLSGDYAARTKTAIEAVAPLWRRSWDRSKLGSRFRFSLLFDFKQQK